jgi:hypothetical protein
MAAAIAPAGASMTKEADGRSPQSAKEAKFGRDRREPSTQFAVFR